MDLSLEISRNDMRLEECLHEFSKPELMYGADKYWCDRCGGLQEALKR
jgi:ubiquitin C-terminal hydrolase